jgi:hypothetical protein
MVDEVANREITMEWMVNPEDFIAKIFLLVSELRELSLA